MVHLLRWYYRGEMDQEGINSGREREERERRERKRESHPPQLPRLLLPALEFVSHTVFRPT